MFDFGEELTVDSYRVPWLIWIQILVLFLLILLLYSFTNFAFDISEEASPSSAVDAAVFRSSSAFAGCFQVGGSQSIKGEVAPSTSRGIIRVEEAIQREDSALTEVSLTNFFHPCFYFRLARMAFLKCLGLDSASDHSSPSEHRKES